MTGYLEGKKIIVIGTGIGGAGVSALLAKEGAHVLILERNPFPGGKAASFEREGFVYDSGVHWLARGERGPLGEIAAEAGVELEFRSMDEGVQASHQEANVLRSGGGMAPKTTSREEREAAKSKREPVKREGPRIGRNDPCPCGSGKKYKNCHGAQG